MWDTRRIRQPFCLVMYLHLHSSGFLFFFRKGNLRTFTLRAEPTDRNVLEAFLTGSVWAVLSQSNGQCYGNLPLYSLIVLKVWGCTAPPPSFERGAWDWYVQFLEGTLHFWSMGVPSRYGSKTNTKSRLPGLHCVEQLNITKYVNFSCCNGLAARQL